MPDSIKAIPSNNPSRFFNPEDKALRGFMGCFLTLNLFPCFPLFSAPVVAAFAFRCITPSYRLSCTFSSFSFYSPSFYSPLRLFRVFFHPSFLFSVSYALFLPFHLIFRAGCCYLRFSMHYPFISVVLHFFFIFFLFPFLLFPAAVVPCFFHPSFLFSVSYALFLPFHLIFRAGRFCAFFLFRAENENM